MDVELLPEAEVYTGGMNFVEQNVHHPGSQECCPSDQHHHPHLKYLFHFIFYFHVHKPNLEFGEAMEVSVDVHHFDSFHGQHCDLRGDCQPDALVI